MSSTVSWARRVVSETVLALFQRVTLVKSVRVALIVEFIVVVSSFAIGRKPTTRVQELARKNGGRSWLGHRQGKDSTDRPSRERVKLTLIHL